MDCGYWGGPSSALVAASPSICSPRCKALSIASPERSSLPGRPGSAQLGFTDTAICSCLPKGYETGSGELLHNGLLAEPPSELA
jgi:hypothetical protein